MRLPSSASPTPIACTDALRSSCTSQPMFSGHYAVHVLQAGRWSYCNDARVTKSSRLGAAVSGAPAGEEGVEKMASPRLSGWSASRSRQATRRSVSGTSDLTFLCLDLRSPPLLSSVHCVHLCM
jgi:hypothetical protein